MNLFTLVLNERMNRIPYPHSKEIMYTSRLIYIANTRKRYFFFLHNFELNDGQIWCILDYLEAGFNWILRCETRIVFSNFDSQATLSSILSTTDNTFRKPFHLNWMNCNNIYMIWLLHNTQWKMCELDFSCARTHP